jgi:spoIIIJ-associated protein
MFNLFKSNSEKPTPTPISITQELKNDAKNYIQLLLKKAGFEAIAILNNDIEDVVYVIIQNEYETSRIIGKDGQTLYSIQIIVQSYLTKKYNQYVPLFVDCNDYLSLKIEKAQEKAKELETKLSEDRKSIELFPMTAIERKAIHNLYQNNEYFTTHSIGEGNDRRIVLSKKDA